MTFTGRGINATHEKKQRFESIDVLRGIAASWVIVFHCLYLIPLTIQAGAIHTAVNFGHFAVPVFFAISAFSILYTYDRMASEIDIYNFFVSRFFRIYPLFFFAIVAWTIFSRAFLVPAPWSDVFLTFSFLFAFVPGRHESVVWAGWSLGVEALFYVSVPFLNVFFRRRAPLVVLLAISLVVSQIVSGLTSPEPGINDYFRMSFGKHLPSFLVGILVLSLVPQSAMLKRRLGVFRNLLSSTGFVVGFLLLTLQALTDWSLVWLGNLAIAVWLFSATLGFPRIITNRFTIHLGKVSYGIYLAHPMVIMLFCISGVYEAVFSRLGREGLLPNLVVVAITVATVYVVASALYLAIEQPFMKWRKRFMRGVENQPHALEDVGEQHASAPSLEPAQPS